ncbi:hypothetical protein EG68_10421 [Paragonimus skrjabini miyazakii]|uniref:DUF4806 domain-containing protein n=1 Tax=Paragonimus skrjabini miyazakii TaxID=59628 RepID=A0A8S9YRK0_9TREM|nr:hypothetical protein EG68_10421 [Paragonimus skrjabini miyazakii]
MFAVVRFVEDNSVAVVSTAWFVNEKTVRWPGSRNLSAYHKLLLAHEALPPNTPQYSVIDVARTYSYIDARAVKRETVEQSSGATSDCTSKLTTFNTRYTERKRRLQALETQTTRSSPPTTSSKPAVMPAMFRSPARTQKKLDEREAELANSQVYDVVLKSLCRMGGTDVADTIRRMMSFLIHNDLAVLMNWSGVCNKWATCDLLSMELVQGNFSSQSSLSYVLQMPSLASRGKPTFLAQSC